jgi:outer membrane biosynthesis protein TonB
MVFYREWVLPWERSAADEDRFRGILRNVCGALFALSVVLTFLPLPDLERSDVPVVPPRLARLVLDKPAPPPPPPVVVPKREAPPVPQVTKPVQREKPPPVPVDRRAAARDKAKAAGLLPFADELADLRDNKSLASLGTKQPLTGAVGDAARNERSLITSKAGRSSGGINTAALSRDTGGAGLGGRGTTRVTSTLAGGGGAGGAAAATGASGRPARSREEIEMVFDQNKGAIYALYSRALRRDPTLQGKLVLRLTIEPDGTVSSCDVVSSELGDDELLQKLVARVRMFRFQDKDVATVTTTKPIDFFPA